MDPLLRSMSSSALVLSALLMVAAASVARARTPEEPPSGVGTRSYDRVRIGMAAGLRFGGRYRLRDDLGDASARLGVGTSVELRVTVALHRHLALEAFADGALLHFAAANSADAPIRMVGAGLRIRVRHTLAFGSRRLEFYGATGLFFATELTVPPRRSIETNARGVGFEIVGGAEARFGRRLGVFLELGMHRASFRVRDETGTGTYAYRDSYLQALLRAGLSVGF